MCSDGYPTRDCFTLNTIFMRRKTVQESHKSREKSEISTWKTIIKFFGSVLGGRPGTWSEGSIEEKLEN